MRIQLRNSRVFAFLMAILIAFGLFGAIPATTEAGGAGSVGVSVSGPSSGPANKQVTFKVTAWDTRSVSPPAGEMLDIFVELHGRATSGEVTITTSRPVDRILKVWDTNNDMYGIIIWMRANRLRDGGLVVKVTRALDAVPTRSRIEAARAYIVKDLYTTLPLPAGDCLEVVQVKYFDCQYTRIYP